MPPLHRLLRHVSLLCVPVVLAFAQDAPTESLPPKPRPPGPEFRKLAAEVEIGTRAVPTTALPSSLRLLPDLGLVVAAPVAGQHIHTARTEVYESRATITPAGDFLLMSPDGGHYNGTTKKLNDLVAYRSRDHGRTWEGPTVPIKIDYNLHGFIPLIPRGTKRLYNFGTQPLIGRYDPKDPSKRENAPIGYRWSDDDGFTWSEVQLISPTNDPEFTGMSVVRMCETDTGVWLIGAHEGDWSKKPLQTRQYILRSADRGKTWTVAPGARPGGWQCPGFGRMDETTMVCLGGNEVFALSRTPEGHLWQVRSHDSGLTWEGPTATTLVHPDAPAMLFQLPDRKTLMVLHHNRSSADKLPMAERAHLGADHPGMRDRAQVWVSLSRDGGRSWESPRFLTANALRPYEKNPFFNNACSYFDAIFDQGEIHFFFSHRWKHVLHLTMKEADLTKLPTERELAGK